MKCSLIRRSIGLAAIVIAGSISHAEAQRPVEIAPNAPKDNAVSADLCQWNALVAATAPYVQKARSTLPGAVDRFRAGLPPKQSFFITTRLSDSLGHHEQAFVVVDSMNGSTFLGRIANQIDLVRGYRLGQRQLVRSEDVVDWMFSKPDGSEEGNEVGKFLDTYRPPAVCRNASF